MHCKQRVGGRQLTMTPAMSGCLAVSLGCLQVTPAFVCSHFYFHLPSAMFVDQLDSIPAAAAAAP